MNTAKKLFFAFGLVGLLAAGCNSSQAPASPDNSSPATVVPTASPTPTALGTPVPTATTKPTPTKSAGGTDNFTISADDSSATLTNVTVKKGDTVNITFKVNANTTYHGGLDFRSANISSGTIAPGDSKTITFTADQTFTFVPYWPASNIKKPYTVTVTVQ